MATKLVNAGLKSKREFATRMLVGEVFYEQDGTKFFYDQKRGNPFILENTCGHSEPILAYWDLYENLCIKKEVEWYENIPEEGVLCWVSEDYSGDQLYMTVIKEFDGEQEYSFRTKSGSVWTYATPVTQEEVNKYLLKD